VIPDDTEGSTPPELVEPITIFAALFIAIVLAGASQTYTDASTAAADEAYVVDNIFEATGYVKSRGRKRDLQAALVCYARAVENGDWQAMAAGATTTEGLVANNWTGTGPHGMRRRFRAMGPADPMFRTLTALDRQRGNSRRARLALAEPQVPQIISALMLILVFASVFTLAFFVPRVDNNAHRGTVLIVGAVLVASLGLVRSLDRPFTGVLAISPSAMTGTAADISEDFDDDWGARLLPCNPRGEPLN